MSNRSLGKDLTTGNITKVLLSFAWPIMLSNLMQTAYGIVDMMIVGNYSGDAGLSAVSSGNDIMNFFLMAGNGLATAGQVMISHAFGSGNRKELNSLIGTLFSCTLILGLLLTVTSVSALDTMLNLVNTPEAAFWETRTYLLLCSLGLTFIFGYNMVSAILRGMGDSRHPMVFIGYAAVMNVVLDYLFIKVLSWGAGGAALATSLSQGTSFLLCLYFLYRNRERFYFDFSLSSFRIRKEYLKALVKLGIPLMIQSSASSISNIYVRSNINPYGVAASAITGVGNKLNNVALIVCNALNTSGAAMIGQSISRKDNDRVKGIFYRVFLFDLLFVTAMSILVLLFPQQLFGLFNKKGEVLSLASVYAPVLALAFMAYAFRSPSLALVNGLGNPGFNLAMGVVEGFIMRIGLSYLLGKVLNMGIYGYWYGSTIASYGYGLVVFPYFFSGKWKNRGTVVAET